VKGSKEKLEDTKNQVAEAKLQMDGELRLEGILSHQALHQHFRSMADSLEDLRQVIMQLGKQDLVEQLKMQRLISEQTRQSLESQLQATDLIQERMMKMEPQKPIADFTALGSTLLQSISGIWMASLERGKKGKGKKDRVKDKSNPELKKEQPPGQSAARPEPMTEQQADELMKALLESSMQMPQAVTDPAAAAEIMAKLKSIMGQHSVEPAQETAPEKSPPDEPDEADEPYVQALPPKEKEAWLMLDRCRLKERLLVSELKTVNRSLLHAKDDKERDHWRNEVETKTLALIACRREARKYLGKSKLPPNFVGLAEAKSASAKEPARDSSTSPEVLPAVESSVSPAKDEPTS